MCCYDSLRCSKQSPEQLLGGRAEIMADVKKQRRAGRGPGHAARAKQPSARSTRFCGLPPAACKGAAVVGVTRRVRPYTAKNAGDGTDVKYLPAKFTNMGTLWVLRTSDKKKIVARCESLPYACTSSAHGRGTDISRRCKITILVARGTQWESDHAVSCQFRRSEVAFQIFKRNLHQHLKHSRRIV